MSFKGLLLLGLLVVPFRRAVAQTDQDPIIETIIESVMETVGNDFDFSDLIEKLNFYKKHPLDINKANEESLLELVFLSPLQVNQIIEYRKENGDFLELYELQAVDGLDLETIRRLLPFITIKNVGTLRGVSPQNLLHQGRHEIIVLVGQVIETQAGFQIKDESKSHYLGSPQRILTRYRYHYGNGLSAALTMEKDAGERFSSKSSVPGFDFYSLNLFYKGINIVRKIAIGDYSLQFGQGLSLWSGLSFGKGVAVSTIPKAETGLKPYSSTNEALFFRGLAATIQVKKIEITPFISSRKLDGSLNQDDQSGEAAIGALNESGLHRTRVEIDNKSQIRQTVYGINTQYNLNTLRLGFNSYCTNFSKSFEINSQVYSSKEFAGKQLSNLGLYYTYGWRNLYLFGEGAHSLSSGFAVINGAVISMSPKLATVFLHRSYQADFHSFFNQGISEASKAVNEKAFYSGLVFTPNRKYELSSYVDFFRFPWLRFRADAPSQGYELLSQFSYTPNKKLKALIRYKFERKQENDNLENTMNFLEEVLRQNYRMEFSYKLNASCQSRSRAEVTSFKKGGANKEFGFLLYQDMIFNPMRSKVTGNFRVALFDTQSFNSRIYAYENDVLYGFSAPAYQNQGLRFYTNVRYRLLKEMDVWFRYSITSYSNIDEVGSGLDKISGNKKSDFKVQLRLQF
ncbi:ComEA family DNA-binding protein [Desertivirga brevis]|uniref:ComEA family DNA-binding protein n=1 Tax=Desertivirga brevis TaxID=2810310 RepID=UPI001A979627|nr:helix-hairpin-helix domain-containing protein [Pedobacter sp. SYSU D00873]